MSNIKSLLLHKNLLAKWQDVECAASPGNLEWLTLYGNPITSQPEYQAGMALKFLLICGMVGMVGMVGSPAGWWHPES